MSLLDMLTKLYIFLFVFINLESSEDAFHLDWRHLCNKLKKGNDRYKRINCWQFRFLQQ